MRPTHSRRGTPLARRCPACLAVADGAARFCGRCGHEFPPTREQLPEHAWSAFKPALVLWLLLLGTNLLLGLWLRTADSDSPAGDVLVTLLSALFVVGFVRGAPDAVAPRLAHAGFDARSWWLVPAVLAGLWAWMAGCFTVLDWLGAETQRYVDEYAAHGWPAWSAFLIIAVCPAIFEELAFRGVIQHRLEELLDVRDAWLVQAAMFSVLHLAPLNFVSHFGMGLAFGWLRNRTGSLVPGMAAHFAWNAWIVASEYGGWSWAPGLG